jgi:predicted CoA-binding protein
MVTSQTIDDFLALRTLAVLGVSRDPTKFGYKAWRDLRDKGFRAYAVNPNAAEIDGERCYPDLASLPPGVEGLVAVIPPDQTERAVREALAAGIRRIWMQPGAESDDAVRFCEENGIAAIYGLCIIMEAPAVSRA